MALFARWQGQIWCWSKTTRASLVSLRSVELLLQTVWKDHCVHISPLPPSLPYWFHGLYSVAPGTWHLKVKWVHLHCLSSCYYLSNATWSQLGEGGYGTWTFCTAVSDEKELRWAKAWLQPGGRSNLGILPLVYTQQFVFKVNKNSAIGLKSGKMHWEAWIATSNAGLEGSDLVSLVVQEICILAYMQAYNMSMRSA